MDADEGLYHAKPQTRGKVAHAAIDEKLEICEKD